MIISSQPANLSGTSSSAHMSEESVESDCNCAGLATAVGAGAALMMGRAARQMQTPAMEAATSTTTTTAVTTATTTATTTPAITATITSRASLTRPASESELLVGTGTSGTSSSGGGRPGHRKSSLALALTPEDEPMDAYTVSVLTVSVAFWPNSHYHSICEPDDVLQGVII